MAYFAGLASSSINSSNPSRLACGEANSCGFWKNGWRRPPAFSWPSRDRSMSPSPRERRRLGLYIPFLLLLAFALAWSAGWLWLRAETLRRLDGARASLAGTGRELSWTSRDVSGFPFRLDVDFTDLSLREPSGWALAFPKLNAEAAVFAPTHWVAVAPAGAAFTRPTGGQVIVGAKVLRASVSDLAARPPRISVEGIALT